MVNYISFIFNIFVKKFLILNKNYCVWDVVGNMLVGIVDKFIDPDFFKTLKKLKCSQFAVNSLNHKFQYRN